jgi:hypothetical protein
MEPERLIIELIRDKLHAAWEELVIEEQQASTAESYWSYRAFHTGYTRDDDTIAYDAAEHADVKERYRASIQTCRAAVRNWERALTVALDRLMK